MSRNVRTMRPFMMQDHVNFPAGISQSNEALLSKLRSGKDFMRKEDLLDGEYYFGDCRNAKCARWSEKDQEFTYKRTKFGSRFDETIKHPDDFEGFDVFIPLYRCYPTEEELVGDDIRELP